MADVSVTHIIPVFPTPLPNMKPEEHLAAYHREVSRTVTAIWKELQDAKAQIATLQAQQKGK